LTEQIAFSRKHGDPSLTLDDLLRLQHLEKGRENVRILGNGL